MLNHMKMIHDNLNVWQTPPDRRGKGSAHIHADGFDLLRMGEASQQGHDFFKPAPKADFQHLSFLQITQNGGIAMAFSHRKLVNAQNMRGWQWSLGLYVQPSLFEHRTTLLLETVADKARTDSKGLSYLLDWLGNSLFPN